MQIVNMSTHYQGNILDHVHVAADLKSHLSLVRHDGELTQWRRKTAAILANCQGHHSGENISKLSRSTHGHRGGGGRYQKKFSSVSNQKFASVTGIGLRTKIRRCDIAPLKLSASASASAVVVVVGGGGGGGGDTRWRPAAAGPEARVNWAKWKSKWAAKAAAKWAPPPPPPPPPPNPIKGRPAAAAAFCVTKRHGI